MKSTYCISFNWINTEKELPMFYTSAYAPIEALKNVESKARKLGKYKSFSISKMNDIILRDKTKDKGEIVYSLEYYNGGKLMTLLVPESKLKDCNEAFQSSTESISPFTELAIIII